MNGEMMTVKAASALAGVSSITVYAWLKNGKIQGQKEGRGIKVSKMEIEALKAGAGEDPIEEPELERARAIVNGEDDETEGDDLNDDEIQEDQDQEDPVPSYLEGLDEDTRNDFKVRMAKRLVGQAVVLRNRRQREAERELLWLAVQELGLADSDEPKKTKTTGAAADEMPF